MHSESNQYCTYFYEQCCFSSLQFVGLVLEASPLDGKLSALVHGPSDAFGHTLLYTLTAIPILLFATVGLFLVLYMHHSWGVVGTVLAHSQVARHTMRSIMLVSLILLPLLIVHFYTTTQEMAHIVQHERLFTLFQDVYAPQVTAGYVEWGSFLAILFLEVPFLFVFFLCKAIYLHRRKQQLSKTDCHLCYWIRVLCDTFGGIGVVAVVQLLSVYLFYCALYLIVSPIFTIAWVSSIAASILIAIVCITMLQQMVCSCSKLCSFGKIIKGLAFLLLGMLCITINYYVVKQLKGDEQTTYSTIRDLPTSLVSSVVTGIYGYIVKKLLFQKKGDISREEMEDVASAPLIQ